MKIIAIDDDPIFLDLLGVLLNNAGYHDVTMATDATEALTLIARAQAPFECFLMDIMMPEIDGLELCSRVRAMPQYAQTPILMLTALADDISIDRAVGVGATDYVTKPLQGIQLGARIRSASILNDQMGKTQRLQKSVLRLESTISNLTRASFDDPLEVLSVPTCLVPDELAQSLTGLPLGVYAINAFALRIEGAETLFTRFSPQVLSDVVSAVAAHIEIELGATCNRFAYYGAGIFGCVAFGRRSHIWAEQGENRFGISAEVSMQGIVAGLGHVRLRFEQKNDVLPFVTGHQAATALEYAVEKLSTVAEPMVRETGAPAIRLEPVRVQLDEHLLDIEDISSNLFLDYDARKKAPNASA